MDRDLASMIKQTAFVFLSLVGININLVAQDSKTRNVILVTLDGFRWQELFQGADSAILFSAKYTHNKDIIAGFWHEDAIERRKKLMPFFWQVAGIEGQLYGNRSYQNKVNCRNPHLFSYPGYNELLTGFVDNKINSNDRIDNPNETVLDFIEDHDGFRNRVAAFATWDVFSHILGKKTSDVFIRVWSKNDMSGTIDNRQRELERLLPLDSGTSRDVLTFYHAFEYLKKENPRVLFIAFDETDAQAHNGRYDQYLKAAHAVDAMLKVLWTWVQSHDTYKDKTTLIVTTDHGRGKGARKSWKNHGRFICGSRQIWLAVIGPDTPPTGEVKWEGKLFQKQVAATMTTLLGLQYTRDKRTGEVIYTVFQDRLLAQAVSGNE